VTTSAASSRDRLIDAASRLFFLEGVGIGVEALCREAGVSKRSMYQMFSGKDDLLAAALERQAAAYQARLLPGAEDERQPRSRVLHVFEQLSTIAESVDYFGCPLVAMTMEVKDRQHPARILALEYKRKFADFFLAEARRGRARRPEVLARQLSMLFDGATVCGVTDPQSLGAVATAVAALMDAEGMA
jgi:AcrR family transcriptional regulator